MNVHVDLAKASAATKQWVDREMLDAIIGGKVRKVRAQFEPKKDRGAYANRWRSQPDFSRPAPHDGRPKSQSGATSFHFSAVITGTAISAHPTKNASATNPANARETYASKATKLVLIENGLAERYMVSLKNGQQLDGNDGRAAFVKSNISPTLAEREAHWDRAWQEANKPGKARIELTPRRGSAHDWRLLANDEGTPECIADAAREIALALATEVQPSLLLRRREIEIGDDDELQTWAEGLGLRFGKQHNLRMVHFVAPRAGTVQRPFVFELPHEFGVADQCAVISEFGDWLGKLGVFYTVVIHAADNHNDSRNAHGHAVAGTMRYPVRDDGSFDLTAGRVLRPGEIAKFLGDETLEGEYYPIRARADVKAMRTWFSVLCNHRLEMLGVKRRLDARRYTDMLIEQEPAIHLGAKRAALAVAGARVEADEENTIRSWSGEWSRTCSEVESEREYYAGVLRSLTANEPELSLAALSLETRFEQVASEVIEKAQALAEFDFLEGVAKSGAARAKKVTGRLIEALEVGGDATSNDRKNEPFIRARFAMAEAHIEGIDEALAYWRPGIAAERAALAKGRKELAELELQLQELLANLNAQNLARAWSEETILHPSLYPSRLSPKAHCEALIEHLHKQSSPEFSLDPDRVIYLLRQPSSELIDCYGLRGADENLVTVAPWRARFEAALSIACERQEQHIGRVLDYVRENGLRTLDRGQNTLGVKVPRTVLRYRDVYREHPLLKAEIGQAEHDYIERHRPRGSYVGSDLGEPAYPIVSSESAVAPDRRSHTPAVEISIPIEVVASGEANPEVPEIKAILPEEDGEGIEVGTASPIVIPEQHRHETADALADAEKDDELAQQNLGPAEAVRQEEVADQPREEPPVPSITATPASVDAVVETDTSTGPTTPLFGPTIGSEKGTSLGSGDEWAAPPAADLDDLGSPKPLPYPEFEAPEKEGPKITTSHGAATADNVPSGVLDPPLAEGPERAPRQPIRRDAAWTETVRRLHEAPEYISLNLAAKDAIDGPVFLVGCHLLNELLDLEHNGENVRAFVARDTVKRDVERLAKTDLGMRVLKHAGGTMPKLKSRSGFVRVDLSADNQVTGHMRTRGDDLSR